jgi:uncharacterized membrane protein YcaP (DUF421 family)
MLENQTPLIEVVVRVVIVYLALIVFVRFAGNEAGQSPAPLRFLAMLLLSRPCPQR